MRSSSAPFLLWIGKLVREPPRAPHARKLPHARVRVRVRVRACGSSRLVLSCVVVVGGGGGGAAI